MIYQCDFLALELVEAAVHLANVLDDHVGGSPIGAQQREVPREHAAIHGFGAAVTHGNQRDLVHWCLFRQGVGDPRGQRAERSRTGGSLALQALVALHSAVGGVAGFAFLGNDLHTVDAAVALVHQRQVI